MAVTLTKPTVGGDAGAWGTILNTALDQLNGYDVFAYKSADESVTSSTTLQDDDHLAGLTLGVGTWVVESMYLFSGAGDIKIAWAHSGTFTGYRGGIGPSTVSTDVLGATAQPVRTAAAGSTTAAITSSSIYGVDGTNWSTTFERGVLVVTVSGTFKVQWAQNFSSGTACIMRAGSYILAHRVA